MSSRLINFILVTAIVMVVSVIGFFAWRVWGGGDRMQQDAEERVFVPNVVVNRGAESEKYDEAMEKDVRDLYDAAVAYAKDHNGAYPESKLKNPCTGVQYCLKSIDINSEVKRYLEEIPQVQPSRADYHYRADNAAKTICVKTPGVLETANTMVFQCTEKGCARVVFQESCW